MTNHERKVRGLLTINRYKEREPALGRNEAAQDAITDILHAEVDPGDELGAEDLLRCALRHFVDESDRERLT